MSKDSTKEADEFREAMKPLIEWIAKNHPHKKVLVGASGGELLNTEYSYYTSEFSKVKILLDE